MISLCAQLLERVSHRCSALYWQFAESGPSAPFLPGVAGFTPESRRSDYNMQLPEAAKRSRFKFATSFGQLTEYVRCRAATVRLDKLRCWVADTLLCRSRHGRLDAISPPRPAFHPPLPGMGGPFSAPNRRAYCSRWHAHVYGLGWSEETPGQDGMRCALFPFS
jgi:hypothetical protein